MNIVVQKQTDKIVSRQAKLTFYVGATLFFLAIVLPIILSLLGTDQRVLMVPLLLGPLILMYILGDLGFVLGFFVFWGTMILMAQCSSAPGQVDNFMPGLAIGIGWAPYLLFYGPVFLLSKSTERYRAKWTGTNLANTCDEDQ